MSGTAGKIKTLPFAMVLLMLMMQAAIVMHYPVHLLEGLSAVHSGTHVPGDRQDHPGDDRCPVCFVAKSFFNAVTAMAAVAVALFARRFDYAPPPFVRNAFRHFTAFRSRGPPLLSH